MAEECNHGDDNTRAFRLECLKLAVGVLASPAGISSFEQWAKVADVDRKSEMTVALAKHFYDYVSASNE